MLEWFDENFGLVFITPFGILVESVLPFLGAVGLVVAGTVWTRGYAYDDADVPRVVGWTVVGMGEMALIFLWILSHQLIRGGDADRVTPSPNS